MMKQIPESLCWHPYLFMRIIFARELEPLCLIYDEFDKSIWSIGVISSRQQNRIMIIDFRKHEHFYDRVLSHTPS